MFDDFQPNPKASKKETPSKKRKSVDKLFR